MKDEWPEKVRRLAVHNNLFDAHMIQPLHQLRSLVMFCRVDYSVIFTDSRLLTVLDLGNTKLKVFPESIMKLFNLKYLSLRNTKVEEIPKSIGRLQNLETLDLKNSPVYKLPNEILELKQLRHLFAGQFGWKIPAKIGCLKSLQELDGVVCSSSEIVREVGKLTQLRGLGITKLRKEHGKELCSSISALTDLRRLYIKSFGDIIDLQNLASPPKFLQKMVLWGPLESLPLWISSLQCIVTLELNVSKLQSNPLEYLEDLPNLVNLYLDKAYEGRALCFKAGKFQRLKSLSLCCLHKLESVTVEEEVMPNLEELSIENCYSMTRVPSGIENLTNLKLLVLRGMTHTFMGNIDSRNNGADCWRVEHISQVIIR